MSRIEIILGSPHAGKTDELIRRCTRYHALNIQTLCIYHMDAHRHSLHSEIPQHHTSMLTDSLRLSIFNSAKVIAIDDAEHFPDLLEFVRKCESLDKHVIIAGADGDTNRDPAGQILLCIPLCNEVTKLHANEITLDGKILPAIFTARDGVSVSRETWRRITAAQHPMTAQLPTTMENQSETGEETTTSSQLTTQSPHTNGGYRSTATTTENAAPAPPEIPLSHTYPKSGRNPHDPHQTVDDRYVTSWAPTAWQLKTNVYKTRSTL